MKCIAQAVDLLARALLTLDAPHKRYSFLAEMFLCGFDEWARQVAKSMGIMTVTPGESAIIAGDIALKAASWAS